jgi:hypothetical protein
MTQEDKQLLLKDLCARLPYGVKILDIPANVVGDLFLVSTTDSVQYEPAENETNDDSGYQTLYAIKPYLRPMLSMTDEEKEEQSKIVMQSMSSSLDNSESATTMLNDWLLSKHFDVRGLINKGLALEAPEDMYKTE